MSYIAPITSINLGVVQIQGVLLEDGSFGVTAQQTNELFQLGITPRNMTRTLNRLITSFDSPGNASKSLKPLPDKDSGTLQPIKVRTVENNKPSTVIPLEMFEAVILELVARGNKAALELSRDLIGLSLKQLFSDAFGIHFDKEDRANWLENRQLARKSFKPCYTDLLKEYQDKHGVVLNYGVEVNRLKASINLPIKPIEEYDEDQIRRWKDGLVTMKTLLNIMPPREAYKVIDIY